MPHLATARIRLEGERFSLKVPLAQFGKSRGRGRLALIVGVNVAAHAFVIRPDWGAKATVGQSLFACDGACVDTGPPACVTAAGGADPFRAQLAAIRASELELVRSGAAWIA